MAIIGKSCIVWYRLKRLQRFASAHLCTLCIFSQLSYFASALLPRSSTLTFTSPRCDQDFVPSSSSHRPKRPSCSVPLRVSEDVDDASVTACPWCRRPLTITAVKNQGVNDVRGISKRRVDGRCHDGRSDAVNAVPAAPKWKGSCQLSRGTDRFAYATLLHLDLTVF